MLCEEAARSIPIPRPRVFSRDTNRVASGVFQERWNWEELGYQTLGRLPPGGDRDGESLHSDQVLR